MQGKKCQSKCEQRETFNTKCFINKESHLVRIHKVVLFVWEKATLMRNSLHCSVIV
jgi:hypothetical protein